MVRINFNILEFSFKEKMFLPKAKDIDLTINNCNSLYSNTHWLSFLRLNNYNFRISRSYEYSNFIPQILIHFFIDSKNYIKKILFTEISDIRKI